ncbi:MAG TPA: SDR family oxidoreductase [Sporichthyaceae bacterium]|jgi:NAD(P)-dependent dehydrogenase (short-subunit alcohol dehydrogenase family)|nr:SDR family oxidoreductase [Sporichthyaceae bacterium]
MTIPVGEQIMSAVLSGRTALVTGSTSGIGRATALHLAELGAHVIVSGRDAERGEATVAAIRAAGGKADFVAADLGDSHSVRELAERATELGGGAVDVLVNNAGVFPFATTAETSEEVLDFTFDVNLKAPYLLVQALAPGMAARGHGAIVNVTTRVAQIGMPISGAYGASKAALELLTKGWATEFGPSGVRVNAVSPGPVRTEGTEPLGDMLDQLAAPAPSRRVAQPEEIASAIGFLVGPGASQIHGTVLPVDGGLVAI